MQTSTLAAVLISAIIVGAGIGYFGSTSIAPPQTKATTYTTTVITSYTYLLTTGDATNESQACIANLANPPQQQYMGILLQIIRSPAFIEYSYGRCWTYVGTFVVSGQSYSSENFVFDHNSTQVYYPCMSYPAYLLDARVYVVPTLSGTMVTGISIEPQSTNFPNYSVNCPPFRPQVGPQSLNLVSWNASGQTVALKLNYDGYNLPIRSLEAKIFNSTWSYTVQFSDVNSTYPFQYGSNVTQTFFLLGSPLHGNVVYDATATYTYVNGTSSSSSFAVQLQM